MFESCCSLHIDYFNYLSTYTWEIIANQHASQFSVSSHVQFVLAFWLTFVLISQLHQKWWPGLDLLKQRINPMLHYISHLSKLSTLSGPSIMKFIENQCEHLSKLTLYHLKERATRRSRRAREPSRIPLLFLRGLAPVKFTKWFLLLETNRPLPPTYF